MYEHRTDPLLPRRQFIVRVGRSFLLAVSIILVSLAVGMIGYHALAGFSWIDAFLNAAMLLGGMGPVGEIRTSSGKLFAGLFALYAGLVLIVAAAVLLTPLLHRVLHRLHLEEGSSPP